VAAADEAAEHRLGHVAGAQEADRLVEGHEVEVYHRSCYPEGVKGSLLLPIVLAAACGGAASETRRDEPEAALPGPDLEPRVRRHAAQYLRCAQAQITLERLEWTGEQGSYVATGCGWRMGYLIACQADGHCGFVPASDPTVAR